MWPVIINGICYMLKVCVCVVCYLSPAVGLLIILSGHLPEMKMCKEKNVSFLFSFFRQVLPVCLFATQIIMNRF